MTADFTFLNPKGGEAHLRDYAGKPLLAVFIRHLMCISCRAHVDDLAKNQEALAATGAQVLIVSFAPPENIARYIQQFPIPFPVVCDPQLAAYKALSIRRASVLAFLRPRVLGHYFKLMLRGWRPRLPNKGEDPLQLGGDFIFDRAGEIVYSHPCQDPSDRPAAGELIGRLREVTR